MDTADRLLLVDGHHLFHRTYNALPRSIIGVDGAPIQGVYGFASAILRLLRRFPPTHLAVPFDPPEPPFRRALFPGYRTGRPRGTPEEVANFDRQVAQVLGLLDHLAIAHPMAPGFEADDAIGTLAAAATAADVPVTIVSGDRDLLQLVGPSVAVFMPKGQDGETYTPAVLQERWGVRPDQFTDLKALVGDASDHIPGVPGIGPKTAASLLATHGTIDALYAALPSLPARQADLLRAHQDRVHLNRHLVMIVRTVEVPTDIEAYRWTGAEPWTAHTLLAALGLRR